MILVPCPNASSLAEEDADHGHEVEVIPPGHCPGMVGLVLPPPPLWTLFRKSKGRE